MSGCYRLAKYNLSEFDGVFTGVPITVAGSTIALFSLVTPGNAISTLLSTILVVIFTYLMVSKLKLKKV